MKRTLALAIVAVVALSGCGGSDEPSDVEAIVTTPAEPAPTPEPDPTGPTVSQWASKIAPIKANWQEQDDIWEDEICSSGLVADPDPAGTYCRTHLVVMGMVASTIESQAAGMVKEGVPAYFGVIPDEVAALHAETIAAAEAASIAGESVECPEDGCRGASFEFIRAWGKLGDVLQSWEPYL